RRRTPLTGSPSRQLPPHLRPSQLPASVHSLTRLIRSRLRQAADPTRAPQMQAYMKSTMPYLGVASPVHKRICKEALSAHRLESFEDWTNVALELWRGARF